MPTVINGIGTWYYGKKRIHTIRETCEFCNRLTDLSSYDTTLFFVVAFVPLIPLQKLRVIRSCAACQRHRLISLAKWEAAKSSDSADLLEALQADPNDRETVMRAVRFAVAYQDEPLFNNTVEALAAGKTDDAEIQTLLGHAYGYFSRWPEAEQAFLAAVAVTDTENLREALAWALLKQDRPDDARPWLRHVTDNQKRESAGTVYYLVKGYQAQGRHDEALEVMDERDKAFPDWAAQKEYAEQRKTSAKYRASGKRVHSGLLSGKAGYTEGNWTANWPKWAAAALLLGAVAAYLGSATWIGQNRKVFLVNGTNKPYAVTVAGATHKLPPQSAVPVRVAEGDVEVAFADGGPDLEPVRAAVETSFWGRPFAGCTFVINPDQTAVVVEEESVYSATNPREGRPSQVHFGDAFYALPGADYTFEPFPPTLSVKGKTELMKSRVGHLTGLAPEARLGLAAGLEPARQAAFARKLLRLDPGETLVLHWHTARLPAEEAIAFVEPRLADRPPLVEWHRVFQTLTERARPAADLRPMYQRLVAETNGHADAIYLLGRCDPDPVAAEQLYRRAATASAPSAFACQGMGFRAMSEGKFAEAAEWYEKALNFPGEKTFPRQGHRDALLAAGNYDALVGALRTDAGTPGRRLFGLTQTLRVQTIRGDQAAAGQTTAEILRECPPHERPGVQRSLDAVTAAARQDAAGYLKATGADEPSFETAFLTGQTAKAAEMATPAFAAPGVHQGLLWLAADQAGDKVAAEKRFGVLLDELKTAGRDERRFGDILAGRQPDAAGVPEKLPIDVASKRVLLAVLARRRPERSAELSALAKKLDFQRDAISLCLAKVRPKE